MRLVAAFPVFCAIFANLLPDQTCLLLVLILLVLVFVDRRGLKPNRNLVYLLPIGRKKLQIGWGNLTDWVSKAYDSDGVGIEPEKPFVLIHLCQSQQGGRESTDDLKTTFWVRSSGVIDQLSDFSYSETHKK